MDNEVEAVCEVMCNQYIWYIVAKPCSWRWFIDWEEINCKILEDINVHVYSSDGFTVYAEQCRRW